MVKEKMYSSNIAIDRPRWAWSDSEVEKLFLFCLLDRASSYEQVCRIHNGLESLKLLSFKSLKLLKEGDLSSTLKQLGCRFPVQTAKFIEYNIQSFTISNINLMSRDELVTHVKGFGYKLASMFHNRLHNTNYAIIDVHIDRYLKENNCKAKNYKDKEVFFFQLAEKKGMTPDELDWKIWDQNRIGNRKNKKWVGMAKV